MLRRDLLAAAANSPEVKSCVAAALSSCHVPVSSAAASFGAAFCAGAAGAAGGADCTWGSGARSWTV